MRTRRNVPGVMVNLPRVFNEIFNDDAFKGLTDFNFANDYNRPAVNIKETDDAFHLEMVTPGFEKNDFNIEVVDGKLNISAEAKVEENREEDNYTHREFYSRAFSRTFILPEEKADQDKIDAEYKNGILFVTIAKKEEAKPQPARLVEVK